MTSLSFRNSTELSGEKSNITNRTEVPSINTNISQKSNVSLNQNIISNAIDPSRFSSNQLLALVQQLAEQDVRKMFAGIQKTHENVFEEAKTWDGKLPPRKKMQEKPNENLIQSKRLEIAEKSERPSSRGTTERYERRERNTTSERPDSRGRSDKTQLNPAKSSRNETKNSSNITTQRNQKINQQNEISSDYSSDIDSEHSDLTDDIPVRESVFIHKEPSKLSQQRNIQTTTKNPETKLKNKLNINQKYQKPQNIRDDRLKNIDSTNTQRSNSENTSRPPSGLKKTQALEDKNISKDNRTKIARKDEIKRDIPEKKQKQPITQTNKENIKQKLNFDEGTSIDQPYYYDENIQTGAFYEDEGVQEGVSYIQNEVSVYDNRNKNSNSTEPSKATSTTNRKQDLKRTEEIRKSALEQFSPKKRDTQKTTQTMTEASLKDTTKLTKLQKERNKRKQILAGKTQRKIIRPPSPSALHQKHARIAEIARLQREEEAMRRQKVTKIPLKTIEDDENESQITSMSARVLPKEAFEEEKELSDNTQDYIDLPTETEEIQPIKMKNKLDTLSKATSKLNINDKKKADIRIIAPNSTFDEISSQAVEPNIMTAEHVTNSIEEPKLIINRPENKKLKLFEILKQGLLENRITQLNTTEENAPGLIILNQSDESSQIETIYEPKQIIKEIKPEIIEKKEEKEILSDNKNLYMDIGKKNEIVSETPTSEQEEKPIKKQVGEQIHPPILNPIQDINIKSKNETKNEMKNNSKKETKILNSNYPSILNNFNIEKELEKHDTEVEEIRKRLLESKRSPSPSISSTPSSHNGGKSPTFVKKRKPRMKVHTSEDFRRSSFSVSKVLSPIQKIQKDKELFQSGYKLSEGERNEILSIKSDIDQYWRKTSNAIGDICSDVEPHILFEIIADVINDEVFEDCCREVQSICDDAVQNIFKAEFDVTSIEFSSTLSSNSTLV